MISLRVSKHWLPILRFATLKLVPEACTPVVEGKRPTGVAGVVEGTQRMVGGLHRSGDRDQDSGVVKQH